MLSAASVVDNLPVTLPAIAYTVLQCQAPLYIGLLPPVVLLVDLIRRVRRGRAAPARAIGTEKRKVRRLNEASWPISMPPAKRGSTLSSWSGLLFINALLTACVLDHLATSLSLSASEPIANRLSSLTPTSAQISLRLPGKPSPELVYRPIAPGIPWTRSQAFKLDRSRDWGADVVIDGLVPGVQYEYAVSGAALVGNFTTFPGRHQPAEPFRFLHAGQPANHAVKYGLPRSLSLSRWRRARLRAPAWDSLVEWVHDLRSRTAWTSPAFALIGGPMSNTKAKRIAAGSVDAWSALPIIPAYSRSPNAHTPEPAALHTPDRTFSYGDTHFFRIHAPRHSHREDDQDWRVDMDELRRELASTDATAWKFVILPRAVSGSGSRTATSALWDKALLDLLAPMDNVIILAESRGANPTFRATLLLDSIVQLETPPLDGSSRPFLSSLFQVRPHQISVSDAGTVSNATGVPHIWVLKHADAGSANWVSLEVHGRVVHVVFVRNGQAVWHTQIVSHAHKPSAVNSGVGFIGQSLRTLLESIGLLSTRWF